MILTIDQRTYFENTTSKINLNHHFDKTNWHQDLGACQQCQCQTQRQRESLINFSETQNITMGQNWQIFGHYC